MADGEITENAEEEKKVKKEPLSLEELLAKKKAEMQAETKVRNVFLIVIFRFLCNVIWF